MSAYDMRKSRLLLKPPDQKPGRPTYPPTAPPGLDSPFACAKPTTLRKTRRENFQHSHPLRAPSLRFLSGARVGYHEPSCPILVTFLPLSQGCETTNLNRSRSTSPSSFSQSSSPAPPPETPPTAVPAHAEPSPPWQSPGPPLPSQSNQN